MKPLRELSAAEYTDLLTSGRLWERYPDATGNYVDDTRPMNLQELLQAMNADRDKADDLYGKHFLPALKVSYGLNDKQASAVAYAAYEEGHSAGYSEVVSCAFDLGELARKVLDAQ